MYHPSILPEDFSFGPTGELKLNLPRPSDHYSPDYDPDQQGYEFDSNASTDTLPASQAKVNIQQNYKCGALHVLNF